MDVESEVYCRRRSGNFWRMRAALGLACAQAATLGSQVVGRPSLFYLFVSFCICLVALKCTGILFEEPNPEREPPKRPNWARQEVTVTSVSLPPFVSRRGLSNTNQRLSLSSTYKPTSLISSCHLKTHPSLSSFRGGSLQRLYSGKPTASSPNPKASSRTTAFLPSGFQNAFTQENSRRLRHARRPQAAGAWPPHPHAGAKAASRRPWR